MTVRNINCETKFGSGDYHIVFTGKLNGSWTDWFDGMDIITEMKSDGSQLTMMSGWIRDQSALRGLLNKLWDLNLVLISLQKLEGDSLS